MTDAPNVCHTPETFYEWGWESEGRTLVVKLRFPFDAAFWLRGESALTEPTKEEIAAHRPRLSTDDARNLVLYDKRAAERKRITDLIHEAMEPVGADCYRAMRHVDEIEKTSRVDDGIAAAIRRRKDAA